MSGIKHGYSSLIEGSTSVRDGDRNSSQMGLSSMRSNPLIPSIDESRNYALNRNQNRFATGSNLRNNINKSQLITGRNINVVKTKRTDRND